MNPILSLNEHQALMVAKNSDCREIAISLDIEKSTTQVQVEDDHWGFDGRTFPFLKRCKPDTFYYWDEDEEEFSTVAVFDNGFIKLVPTRHGPPTFHIDGVKMLPSSKVNPFIDAKEKVALVNPGGKKILDTCGGLGYFAHWCFELGAAEVCSFEKNPNVLWLRKHNPWSPEETLESYKLTEGSVLDHLTSFSKGSFGAILHDPPRFGLAGELYSLEFYKELRRVLQNGGKLFHYTGSPNKKTTGRDVPGEVMRRLSQAKFKVVRKMDGLLAVAN